MCFDISERVDLYFELHDSMEPEPFAPEEQERLARWERFDQQLDDMAWDKGWSHELKEFIEWHIKRLTNPPTWEQVGKLKALYYSRKPSDKPFWKRKGLMEVLGYYRYKTEWEITFECDWWHAKFQDFWGNIA